MSETADTGMGKGFDPQPHLMKVRGGQLYLEVKWRLVWLREAHPDASVEVQLTHLDLDRNLAVACATVTLPNGTKATEIGSETEQDFPAGWIEKAATKAVGRALAALGFGTQFALELDEGEHLVDSPVTPASRTPARNGTTAGARQRSSDATGGVRTVAKGTTPAPAQEQAQAPAQPRTAATQDATRAQNGQGQDVAALRAQVAALGAQDAEGLTLLQKAAGGRALEEWSVTELRKALPWFQNRQRRAQPPSALLSRQIAAARSEQEVGAARAAVEAAKDARQITQAERMSLHAEVEKRRTELAGPLTERITS